MIFLGLDDYPLKSDEEYSTKIRHGFGVLLISQLNKYIKESKNTNKVLLIHYDPTTNI